MLLTAEVLEGMVNSCLRKGFDHATETPTCHREWWQMCCSKRKLVAISAPRGFAKSTAITHSYTLAAALFRERKYILVVSDTVTQAVQFLGDIKREIGDNDDLRELFGIHEFVKDTEDDLIVRFTDGGQFRIQAKGAEQKLRGLKWDNKRPDLVVCDDIENDEAVSNRDRRTKLKRWFYGALVPILADNGIIRIVGTILHMDSLLESLMPENQLGHSRMKQIIREELKEYTECKTVWYSAKYKAHNEDFSKLLWPVKKSAEQLKEIREDYIRQGLQDVYSQEYLNIPIDEARSFFKRNDFHPLTEVDKKRKLNYYIAADLAISGKQRSDYTVFIVGGVDEDGILYIRNVIRDRLDGMEIVETILSLQKMYSPVLFSIEDGTITKSIGPYLNEQMLRRNIIVNLKLLKPATDKISRAQTIQARMRAGGVKFDTNAEWFATFEDELMKFPRDRHDDQVDAFAYLGLIVDRMSDADTAEEIIEEEYEEMVKESNYHRQGVSQICGY